MEPFRTVSPPPPPPPPPRPVNHPQAPAHPGAPANPAASTSKASADAAAALGKRQPDQASGFIGVLGGFAQGIENAALRTEVKPVDAGEARQDLAQLGQDFKAAKSGEDLQAIARKADELQGRAMVSPDQQLPPDLQQAITHMRDRAENANQALTQLYADHQSLARAADGPARSAVAAHLLANPGEMQQRMAALGPLKDSPLGQRAQDWAQGVAKLATPDALGKQLAKDPDLANYPPGTAADLGKLRGLPNATLQGGLDAVGKQLLAQSAQAKQDWAGISPFGKLGAPFAGAQDPLTFAAVKANPALGQLIAPLAASKDPAVAAQVQNLAQGWVQQSLKSNLDANRQGPPTSPDANAKNSLDGFQRELANLGQKTGMGPLFQAALPDAMKAEAQDLATSPNLTFDALKQNPAYGQLLAQYKDDPTLAPQIDAKVKDLIGQGVDEHLAKEKKQKGVEQGMGDLKNDLLGIAKSTGLGDVIGRNAEGAIHDHQKSIHDALNRGKSWWDDVTGFATSAFNDLAKGVAEPFKLLGSGGAAVFDAVGLHGLAHDTKEFGDGVGDGLGSTVSGFGQMLVHPMQAAKGIGGMLLHPSRLEAAGKAIFDQAMQGGLAHGLGYAVGTLAPTLLGGGVAGTLGKGVDALSAADIPVLSGLAAKASEFSAVGLKVVGAGKAAFGQDVGKLIDVAGKGLDDTKGLQKVADVGDHTLLSGTKVVAGKAKDAGGTLRDVVKAEDSKAAATDLVKGSYTKAKDAVLGTDTAKDTAGAIRAIKTPKGTARDVVTHVKAIKTAVVEGKDTVFHGKGVAEGTKLVDRIGKAGDHIGTSVDDLLNSDAGKLGNTVANTVGIAVSPGSFLKSHLPGAIFQRNFNRVYKKLNVDTQANLSGAEQVAQMEQLARALDLGAQLPL